MNLDSDLIDFSTTNKDKVSKIPERNWSRMFSYKVCKEKNYVSIEGFANGFDEETLTNLIIPPEIDGYSVKEISSYSFYDNPYIQYISLPNSIVYIGDSAFEYCINLKSIDGLNNVKEFGESSFKNCESLSEIKLSKRLASIGDYAFSNCDKITSITLPDCLETIGVGAFEYCKNLKSVYIENNVKEISDSCFSYCVSLEEIKLSKILKTIGDYAFSNCAKIISIILPDYLESIGVGSFEHCRNLKSVYVGNNVKEIGDSCFSYCVSLEEIKLPPNLETIGSYAFSDCKNLNTIVLPNSLEKIGVSAFENCNHVKIENFHIERFSKESNEKIPYIKEILSDDNIDELEFYDFYEFVSQNNSFLILSEQENYNILYTDDRKNCGLIYGEKFHDQSIKKLSISNLYIRYKQYYDDKNSFYASCLKILARIDFEFAWSESFINSKIEEIFHLYENFLGCKLNFISFLENELEDMIEHFNKYFYQNFSKNTMGYFFNKLCEICYTFYEGDGFAFISCINEAYHNHILLENISKLSAELAGKLSITKKLFLPSNIIEIRDNALKNSKLLYIDGNVKRIGKSAFQHCKKLYDVHFPNLEDVDDLAFSGCSSLEKFIFPNTIRRIGTKAFYNCIELKELYIPTEIEEIEDFAFQDCENLRKITVPKRFVENKSIFKNCNKLKTIKFSSEGIQNLVFDKNKITTIQNQTNVLAAKLDEIFTEDTEEHLQDNNKITEERSISSMEEQNKIKIPESNRQFLVYMSDKEIVSRPDAQAICKSLNIMLDGILDSLNDKSFELFDDVIFELDNNEIFVNQEYAKELIAKTYCDEKKNIIEKNIQNTIKSEQPEVNKIAVIKKDNELTSDKINFTSQNKDEKQNNSLDPMEIIKKEIGGVVVIKFNKEPPKQVLEILKATGWRYNNIQQTWYSSELSNKGCLEFAQRMKRHFFP